MTIQIHSPELLREVMDTVGIAILEHVDIGPGCVDGLLLLKHCQSLVKRLCILSAESAHSELHTTGSGNPGSVVSKMMLLVYGILSNSDVFKSYGHARLAREGRLAFEQWKAF